MLGSKKLHHIKPLTDADVLENSKPITSSIISVEKIDKSGTSIAATQKSLSVLQRSRADGGIGRSE